MKEMKAPLTPRVLHVASEAQTLSLFVEQLQPKFKAQNVSFSYGFDPKSLRPGIEIYADFPLHLPRNGLIFISWLRNRRSISRISDERFDVIHVHTPATALALFPHLRRLKQSGARVFYTGRGGFDEGVGPFRRLLWNLIDPLVWKIWDGVGTINSALYNKAILHYPSRPTFRFSYGGATPNLAKQISPDAPKDPNLNRIFTLVWVGRFARDKKLADFLRLVKLLNKKSMFSFRGLVIGGSAKQDAEKVRTKDNDLSFLGWVKCPQEVLSQADLLISTSIREGYGLTLLEAALVGTPAMAYRTNGTLESAGLTLSRLVKPGDVDGLAQAILRWAKVSESQKFAIRENIRQLSSDGFAEGLIFDELMGAYQSVIALRLKSRLTPFFSGS